MRNCPHGDFTSPALHAELPQERYIEALERDIEAQAGAVPGRSLVSIFMGGGTPSLFAPESIARVLQAARRYLVVPRDVEVTLEANPGTIERGRFAEYASAGVNRVSLGGQSFDDAALSALGRIHSSTDTATAVEELHAAGLGNFNIDLMYALPGQDVEKAVADVERAIELSPAHISHYQLTIEHGTVFAAAPPLLPTDDLATEMLARCGERLRSSGFGQYEISAYARPGRRCAHNLNYWTFGDYLGVGAGAHGKLTLEAAVTRSVQLREPRRYLASEPRSLERKVVEGAELPFEFMLNALRLVDGFEPATFTARTGLAWESILPRLESLAARGLVEFGPERCHASARGLRFLNDLLLEFLPEKPAAPRFPALSTGS